MAKGANSFFTRIALILIAPKREKERSKEREVRGEKRVDKRKIKYLMEQ